MAYKKQKIHEQTRSIKHIHAENTVVIREKGAGSGKCEMMKADHLYGDEWRLIFGDEHTGVYTEIECCTQETNIVLINQMSPQ